MIQHNAHDGMDHAWHNGCYAKSAKSCNGRYAMQGPFHHARYVHHLLKTQKSPDSID
jgi:hypothetical protein